MSLELYIEKFKHLNTNTKKGHRSPHKVCMLLAVMDLIHAGYIHQNKIYFDEELKKRFTHYFNKMKHGDDQDSPENPFYYLKSEGFWHIAYQEGIEPKSVKGYSAKKVSHAFLDDELFGYMKSNIVCGELKDALTCNLTNLFELYTKWLLDLGKSEATARKYRQAIHGSISNWLGEHLQSNKPLSTISSYREFHLLAEQAKQLASFKISDQRGKGMYSAALKSYSMFLADVGQVDIKSDIAQIIGDRQLTETEKTILVNTRMGQGRFRHQLVDYWKGCALTGYQDTRLLVASHIKPWRDATNEERLDTFNGLLLLANIDKAFDLGFISFRNNGEVMLSGHLEAPEVLGLAEGMAFTVHQNHKRYLDYHRQELFKGY